MSSDTTRQAPSRTLLILGFGTLPFVLAQTTVIPALGDLQRELDASASGIAWMVTAYLLVASIATPIIGREFPKHKVPTGIALLGAIAAIGSSIGLPLGGVLVDEANYHWIFWVAAIMGVGLTALLIGISRAADWGWDSAPTLGLTAVGLIVLVLFGLFERRTPQPLVNMRTFARRPVLTTNVSTVLIGSAMISTFMLVPLLAQLPAGGETGFGLSATEAGLLLAAGGLLSLLIAPIVGRIGERSGSKTPFLVGCLVTAGALLGMALAHDSVGLVILWSCITSAGVGAAFAAIPNLIVSAVDEHATGEATGVNTVMRNIGSAVGAQVAGTII